MGASERLRRHLREAGEDAKELGYAATHSRSGSRPEHLVQRLDDSLNRAEDARKDLQAQYTLWHHALYGAQRGVRRAQLWAVLGLLVLAVAGYGVAFAAVRGVLDSVAHDRFGPSDTAQVITAVGGLTTAVGVSVAAVIKAVALLIHSRADMLRARAGLPPGNGESGQEPSGDETASL